MKKKAILFTISTILLLIPLFFLNMHFMERNKRVNEIIVMGHYGADINYFEDDITDNAYFELLNVNLTNITTTTTFNLNFTQLGIFSDSYDYSSIFNDYETFIENSYSSMNNIQTSLLNFAPNFTVSPYDISFEFDTGNFYCYNHDDNNLNSISAMVFVNQTKSNLVTNTTPSGTGVPITVDIRDKNGQILLDEITANLNPNANNNPFHVDFNDGSGLDVYFENYNGQSGTFYLQTNSIEATLINFDINYDTIAGDIIIDSDSNLSINYPLKNITKNNQIILYQ